jgi:1-deoxy-D-xylulose-5-phosphate synthase
VSDKIIDSISLPQGLRLLDNSKLKLVAKELREELIDSVAESGGHFASSLGTTELTVILHHLFETPKDKIVWDVGHQAYIHKMITGRRDRMHSIRKKGGISGFLKRDESEYDSFGAGHAGTSISAAVGMSVAHQQKESVPFVISVIGDGSLTSGMAFEALNHAGHLNLKNFIVVLNDNEMSISENVGALSRLFSKTVTSQAYTQARAGFKQLHKSGYVPDLVYKVLDRAEEAAQSFVSHTGVLFEAFGFRYIGPIDGHNIDELSTALQHAKNQDRPVLVHIRTAKGKGYEPAEVDPITWHGVTPFDRSEAKFLAKVSSTKTPPSYTKVFADSLSEISSLEEGSSIVAITAAMPGGTGLDSYAKKHPDKFFDVGICEQHAVTFAAGLACEGKKPVCAIYSTFLQRGYDQVVHDVCIQKLPVVFAMDRGGVVGNDGETHQGVFDISYLRSLPHIVLMAPKDEAELRQMLYTAVKHDGPIAVRYPRGNGMGVPLDTPLSTLPIGKAELITSGHEIVLIAYGTMVQTALLVADKCKEIFGISPTIINARFAKPLDEKLLCNEIPRHKIVATLEDHSLINGFGSAVLECINNNHLILKGELLRFGIKDEFVTHGSQAEQHHMNECDVEGVFRSISKQLELVGSMKKAS